MAEETDNTLQTDKPWLWKKGFCPNPGGRPAGKSMKAYAKEYLSKLTDEEKDKWLDGMDKEVVFKMAEGNPAQDMTSGGEKIQQFPIYGGQSVQGHLGDSKDLPTKAKD
jgi:hypothetical protein